MKTAKSVPASAARAAQAISDRANELPSGRVRVWHRAQVEGGELIFAERETGNGRATCALCDQSIAQGAASLRCAWRADEATGHFLARHQPDEGRPLTKFHVHRGECPDANE